MYILLFLVIVMAIALAARLFLSWTFAEVPDDSSTAQEAAAGPPVLFDPRTWEIFRPKPLLSYRRDKRGRFRKMP